MKTSTLLLALLTSLVHVHAQGAAPLPPPAEDVHFEATIEPAPSRDEIRFFAQARPDENRDRNNQRPPEPRPPGVPNPPPPPGERGNSFGSSSESRAYSSGGGGQNRFLRMDSRGRSARPVVVTSKPLDAKELATVEEDLGIMARLLEKEIEREDGAGGPPNAMGITLTRHDGRGPSVMLLEGYGAVFTFNVRMALTTPPARLAEKKPERPTDSPWERTRRELFGSPDEGGGRSGSPEGQGMRFEYKTPAGVGGGIGGMMGLNGSGVITSTFSRRDEPPHYDAKKVEELKKSILEALKQAGNIRALKADDYLTVIVQGSGGGGFGPMEVAVETRTTTSSAGGGPPHTETFVNRSPGGDGPRSGTLTVRAKKSDAEDFAKGKLNAEQFAKKALVSVQ